jgi:hypothetical protein
MFAFVLQGVKRKREKSSGGEKKVKKASKV